MQRGALPPTQGFVGAGMLPPSPQGVGGLASAAQAKAEAAARARAAEQMALEDAWKALNPDFRTPFASVEDAVSRCVRARARSMDRSIFLAARRDDPRGRRAVTTRFGAPCAGLFHSCSI